jgi:hypothetical protein
MSRDMKTLMKLKLHKFGEGQIPGRNTSGPNLIYKMAGVNVTFVSGGQLIF